MGSLSMGRAASTMASPRFLYTASLVVVGSLVSSVATNWLRSNVFDVPFPGGDALYSLVAGGVVMAVMGGSTGRSLALGCAASGTRTLFKDLGVL